MTLEQQYKKDQGLIHKLARRVQGRTTNANLAMDYDDIFQELSMAYIDAYNGYNPDSGFAFSSYFTKCAYTHINKIVNKESRHQIDLGGVSMNQPHGDSSDVTLVEIVECDRPQPDFEVFEEQELSKHLSELSDAARDVARWVIDPPEIVKKELWRAQNKAQIEIEQGQKRKTPSYSVGFVSEMYSRLNGLSVKQKRELRRELTPLTYYI